MNKTLLFVHPSMSVKLTFSIAKKRGYKIFSIITDIESSKINKQLIEELSDYVYYSSGAVEENCLRIENLIKNNALQICGVINGIDAGLYYADYLHNFLVGHPKINIEFSKLRQNKFAVNKILADHNIRTIPSIEIENINDLKLKRETILSLQWPIIAKPSENTAAMAGFAVLHHFDDLVNYVEKMLGSKNAYYDNLVNKIILQKYIPIDQFDEFVLDFVSYQGNHYLQGLSTYEKELVDGQYIFRGTRALLPSEVKNISPVIKYVESILDALRVTCGFTHNEIFWDRKNCFYLIESNTRLAGSGAVDQYNQCYGYTPFHAFLDLLENNKPLPIPVIKRKRYGIGMKLYNFSTLNPNKINLTEITSDAELISLYQDKVISTNFDDYTRADSIAAQLLLTNKSAEKLEIDINKIKKREKENTLFLQSRDEV